MRLLDLDGTPEAQLGPLRLPEAPGLWCNPLDDELAERLVRRSRDRRDGAVRQLTRDLERFGSFESLQRWVSEREHVLCLHTSDDLLLGVLWLACKPLPERTDYDDGFLPPQDAAMTWAIRLYGPARGRGLAAAFATRGLGRLLNDADAPPAIWYETRAQNQPVRRFTQRLGFEEVSGEIGGSVIGVRPAGLPLTSAAGSDGGNHRSRGG